MNERRKNSSVLLLNLYLYTQCMEIRAANFTQQAWKQKNFILHFAIIFSLYNSPSDMQYRLSINISVAFRAHTFPYSCFRYGARIRIYGRPVPYAN